jgi:hypothetical protein
MSDFNDPRNPLHRDPIYGGYNDPALRNLRSEAFASNYGWAWLLGLILVVGVLIFAFGQSDGPRMAQTDTSPAMKLTPAPAPVPPATMAPKTAPAAPGQ